MARLATEGVSERDAMLKKGVEGISSDKKVGNVAKWRKNGDADEREMRQQMSTSEIKAKRSPTSSHHSDVEHEQNLRENEKYSIMKSIRVFLKFIYHDGYVCNRTICAWFITILYLLFIYIFLALIMAAGIYIMLHTTRDAPVYYGETTFIGGVPGIIINCR
ncbi:unnamed protein product [Onchocerca flexuosa]|uniref:SAYSvFN domain-containing protein n=1 Tax=Onchocerca flexuosa TaxID=387005 RepID=A0A183H948_9BILA|nr:unnamed protein product [Onchocerca flexuosa]